MKIVFTENVVFAAFSELDAKTNGFETHTAVLSFRATPRRCVVMRPP